MVTCSIVAYNNPVEMLSTAIKSFLDASSTQAVFYLIDNSPLDDLRKLAEMDGRIIYVHNPSNPGFGAAHNLAIKKAKALGSMYHLVLNPDVYFGSDVIEKLKQFMDQHPEVGNVMPKVLYPDGEIQYLCKLLPTPYDWIGRRFNPVKSMVDKRNQVFELRFTGYNQRMEVPYLSGCFMFLRMSALENIGLFDENIFMYGEEADLCRRLIGSGYKTVFYPDAEIYHHFEKGSHKTMKLSLIGIRSAIYYFSKWGWLFDTTRVSINKKTLDQLNYKN